MRKKIIILSLVLAVFLTLPMISNGQTGFITNLAAAAIGKLFYVVAYVIGLIGGALFAFAGLFVDLTLGLNLQVLGDSNVLVRAGWAIVRDIANLGFVLAIIIIALATVLRWEEYGFQKLLPRLIAAAILINFSFAIAGIFIDFSHVLTNFFFDKVSLNPLKLADTLAGAFNPQDLLEVKSQNIESTLGAISTFGESVVTGIMSLTFTAVFTIAGALTLLLFAILLFLRYLWLTFLLIIAPIVWLFWVLPGLEGQFKKWWDRFLEWVFFAPASAFFVYLALLAAESLRNSPKVFGAAVNAQGFILGTLVDIFGKGAQMIVLVGIMIGGLIVAQKMGIEGSEWATGIATKAGSAAKGWAGRHAMRAGTAALRAATGRKFAENLQQTGTKYNTKTLGGKLGKLITAPIRGVGTGLSTMGIVQGENLIKQSEEKQKGISDRQLSLRIASMNNFDRVAALARLAKNKNLDMVPNFANYIKNEDTKKIFEAYGKSKEYGDMEKTFGANTAMLNAKTDDERNKAANEFFSKFSKSDFNKVQYNDIYSSESKFGLNRQDHDLLQHAITYGIATNNPGDTRKILANVKSENIGMASYAIHVVKKDVERTDPETAEKIGKVLKNNLTKRFEGELFEFEQQPGGTT